MIVSIGSINADMQVRLDERLPTSGSTTGHEFLRTSGGKAANVAYQAQRLGSEVMLLGCVGADDLAVQALAGVRYEGVDVSSVARGSATNVSLISVAPSGEKTIVLSEIGADSWNRHVDEFVDVVRRAPDDTVLVVDLEMSVDVAERVALTAHERGFTIVIDPAPPERMTDVLFDIADHLTPDHREATQLTGVDASSDDGAMKAATILHERGASVVYVKLKDGGCAVASDVEAMLLRPPDGKVVDETGAGDAFAGALAWALDNGRAVRGAAASAVAASTLATRAYGSQDSYAHRPELFATSCKVAVSVY